MLLNLVSNKNLRPPLDPRIPAGILAQSTGGKRPVVYPRITPLGPRCFFLDARSIAPLGTPESTPDSRCFFLIAHLASLRKPASSQANTAMRCRFVPRWAASGPLPCARANRTGLPTPCTRSVPRWNMGGLHERAL
jgi:hypothetical protein